MTWWKLADSALAVVQFALEIVNPWLASLGFVSLFGIALNPWLMLALSAVLVAVPRGLTSILFRRSRRVQP